jgi:hypothetical protein
MRRTRVFAAITAALAATVLAGCSYATPDTSSIGVSYTGGAIDSQRFDKCVQPGSKEVADSGGEVYYYPVGTRTWDFSTRPGADSPPILVSTKNNQELVVSGTITFTLDTNCGEFTAKDGRVWPGGKIQLFHDTIGRSKGAYFGEDSSVIPQGWRDTLGLYLGGPANRAMDQNGGSYEWQNLYSSQDSVNAFTKTVKQQIPSLIEQQTGGENFFNIIDIQLDKPTVPDGLKAELENRERAILAQQTAQDQVNFANGFPGGLPGYAAYQEQQARTKCYNDGRCTAVPVNAANVGG